jgi:hypothetical protein
VHRDFLISLYFPTAEPECSRHSSWTVWPLKMGPIYCVETSVTKYQFTLRNVPEERIPHLDRGGSLKSRQGIFYSNLSRLVLRYSVLRTRPDWSWDILFSELVPTGPGIFCSPHSSRLVLGYSVLRTRPDWSWGILFSELVPTGPGIFCSPNSSRVVLGPSG